jgi:hypothetical protein
MQLQIKRFDITSTEEGFAANTTVCFDATFFHPLFEGQAVDFEAAGSIASVHKGEATATWLGHGIILL